VGLELKAGKLKGQDNGSPVTCWAGGLTGHVFCISVLYLLRITELVVTNVASRRVCSPCIHICSLSLWWWERRVSGSFL